MIGLQPFPKSNDELVRGVEEYTRNCVRRLNDAKGALYLETAGGESLFPLGSMERR